MTIHVKISVLFTSFAAIQIVRSYNSSLVAANSRKSNKYIHLARGNTIFKLCHV